MTAGRPAEDGSKEDGGTKGSHVITQHSKRLLIGQLLGNYSDVPVYSYREQVMLARSMRGMPVTSLIQSRKSP